MKTYHRISLVILFLIGSVLCITRADNPQKEDKDAAVLNQTAMLMVQQWTQDVQLAQKQQEQLLKQTLKYLQKRQEIFDKEEKKNQKENKGKKQRPSEELKAGFLELSLNYQADVESILTEEQKVKSEEIRKKHIEEIREKDQQAAKAAYAKKKKNQ